MSRVSPLMVKVPRLKSMSLREYCISVKMRRRRSCLKGLPASMVMDMSV